jgi:DNA-binding MarR family transcriptional regulator
MSKEPTSNPTPQVKKINEIFLSEEEVTTKDHKHTVLIKVYGIPLKINVTRDKLIASIGLKFVLSYNGTSLECKNGECDAITEISKMTNGAISVYDLRNAIRKLIFEFDKPYEVNPLKFALNFVDVIKEIEKDPFNWVLSHVSDVDGREKEVLLTLLAVVSSYVKEGKLHLLFVKGNDNSAIESVLGLLSITDIVIYGERFDGLDFDAEYNHRVLFMHHIEDRAVNNIAYISGDALCVNVSVDFLRDKYIKTYLTNIYCIHNEPVIIGTTDANGLKQIKPWLLDYFFVTEVNGSLKPLDVKLDNGDRLAFFAYLLTRPNKAELSNEVNERVEKFLKELKGLGNTAKAYVLLKKLLVTTAVAKGKTVVGEEEYEFVMKHFKADLLLNALSLTPLEAKVIKAIDEVGGKTTHELAEELGVSKFNLRGALKSLAKKDIIDVDVDDTWIKEWRLTEKGKAVKKLLEKYTFNSIKD